MPAFLVEADRNAAVTRIEGVDTFVVFATDAAQAKSICESRFSGDANAIFAGATATEITAAADFNGWTLRVTLSHPTTLATVADVTVTGDATNNTIDEIAALAVTALNALDDIANASYDGTGNVLTVAGAADSLGDHICTAELKPPAASYAEPRAVAGLIGTITDEGSAGSAVTVALPADAAVVPRIMSISKRV